MLIPPHVPDMLAMPTAVLTAQAEQRLGGQVVHELGTLPASHPMPANVRRLDRAWTGAAVTYPPDAAPVRTMVILPPGKRLASHPHPFPRVAEVLSGRLRVVQEAQGDEPERVREFKAGDTIVETVGRYHYGESMGPEPARLIVFDYVPRGEESNTRYRAAPGAKGK